jgi:hypothetical protein
MVKYSSTYFDAPTEQDSYTQQLADAIIINPHNWGLTGWSSFCMAVPIV